MRYSSLEFALLLASLSLVKSENIVQRRIYGGEDIDIEKFPFFALVKVNQYVCGGAVLSTRWVITAAHCFLGENNNTIDRNVKVSVAVGVETMDQGRANAKQVSNWFAHPGYELGTNDIALIKLAEELEFNEKVQNVELPEKDDKNTLGKDTHVRLAGFGVQAKDGPIAKKLSGVTFTILEAADCANVTKFKSDEHICAGTIDGSKDACTGDSGGPLVAVDEPLLLGIVSYGLGCAQPGLPGIYTRVSKFVPWIQQTMNSN